MDTNSPTSSTPVSSGKDKDTAMAVLAYLGPLVIISYLIGKDSPSVKFHIKQGLVLVVIEVALQFFGSALWFLFFGGFIFQIVWLALIALSILGIMNALQGKEKELPVVGGFGKLFPI